MMTAVGARRDQGRADRAVDRQRELLGDVDLDEVLARDVREQRLQVDLLLVGAAHRAALGLADDRDDGHVVQLGVVEPVEQVDRAGPLVAMQTPTLPENLA